MSRKFLFAAVATAFSVLSVAAVPSASAGIITVTNVQVPYYESITLKSTASSPINGNSTLNVFKAAGNTEVVAIAGQIILTSNVGLLGVWCVDLFRNISLGGNYTYNEGVISDNGSITTPPSSPTPLTPGQINDIGKLAAYGNFLMSTAPTKERSAAIQAAIWNVEYGTTATGSTAFNTELANVMAVLNSNTLTNPGGVALFSKTDSQGLFTSQGLYKPNSVPEPSTLIIMAFAMLSLLGLAARRQQGIA